MKKLFLVGAMALFGAMNAQQSNGLEGRTFITGQVGFSNTSASSEKTNSFTIAPAVGYFVSPSVAVGLGAGYTYTKVDGASTKTDAFEIRPFARKYWNVAGNLYFFGQADLGLGWANTQGVKYSSFDINVRPGLDYFLSNNWSIEATIGQFGFQSVKPKGGKATNTTNLGVNLSQINFGVKYVF